MRRVLIVVAAFARNFVRNSVGSRVDNRALNFVPSGFNAFISFTVDRSFV